MSQATGCPGLNGWANIASQSEILGQGSQCTYYLRSNHVLGPGVPGVNETHPCFPGLTGQSQINKLAMTIKSSMSYHGSPGRGGRHPSWCVGRGSRRASWRRRCPGSILAELRGEGGHSWQQRHRVEQCWSTRREATCGSVFRWHLEPTRGKVYLEGPGSQGGN